MSNIPYLIGATLNFRPGEQFHLFEVPYDQEPCFAVALVETPPFPGPSHNESTGLSVVCAGWYSTLEGESGGEPRWGWVHLDPESKEMIGRALESIRATPGKWYYLLITGGVGHRPEVTTKTIG